MESTWDATRVSLSRSITTVAGTAEDEEAPLFTVFFLPPNNVDILFNNLSCGCCWFWLEGPGEEGGLWLLLLLDVDDCEGEDERRWFSMVAMVTEII